jgi:hypothetical protein
MRYIPASYTSARPLITQSEEQQTVKDSLDESGNELSVVHGKVVDGHGGRVGPAARGVDNGAYSSRMAVLLYIRVANRAPRASKLLCR